MQYYYDFSPTNIYEYCLSVIPTLPIGRFFN